MQAQAVRPAAPPALSLRASLAELRALQTELDPASVHVDQVPKLIEAIELILDPNRASPADLAPRLGKALATLHTLYDHANPAPLPLCAIKATGAVLFHTLTVELKGKLGAGGVGWLPNQEQLGAPWVACASKIFNGIAVHIEDSVDRIRDSGLSARDQPYRATLATLLPLLTAIVAPPSHARAIVSPPTIKYLAFDLVTDIISRHKANKELLRTLADMAFFGELLFDSSDRLLAIPALEIAYRLLPDAPPAPSAKGKEKARDGDDQRQAAMRALFPKERFGLDAPTLVGMLGSGTNQAFFKTSKAILDHLSLATISRAQPFAALQLLHDSASLAPPPSASHPTETQPRRSSQSQTCVDCWLGRDALAALVGTADNGRTVGLAPDAEVDEEERYWFMLEHVDSVVLDSRPAADELIATFHLSRPALLAFEPLITVETGKPAPTIHTVSLVLLGAGGEILRVLKKTLVERAKRYPKLHPILQTDGLSSDLAKRSSLPSTAGRILPPPSAPAPRKSSQAGPVAAIDPDSSPEQQQVASKESQLDERRGAMQSIAELSQSPTSSNLGNLEDSVPVSKKSDNDDDEIEDADDESGGEQTPVARPFDLTSTRIAPAKSIADADEDELPERFVPDTPRIEATAEQAPVAEDAPMPAADTEKSASNLSDPDELVPVVQEAARPAAAVAQDERESPALPSPSPHPPRILAPESSVPASLPAPAPAVDSQKVRNARGKARPSEPRSPAVEPTRTTRSRAAKLAEAPPPPKEDADDDEDEPMSEIEAEAVPATVTKKRRSTSPPPPGSELDPIVLAKVKGKGKGNAPASTKKKARVEFVDAPAYPKRGKLSDPSPLDPDAATATTLVETDKSSGPYTLDQPRLLVAPKRRYGKQRKSLAKSGAGARKSDAADESDAEETDYDEQHEAPSAKKSPARGVKRKARTAKDDSASQVYTAYNSPATAKARRRKGKVGKAPSHVASEHEDDRSPETSKPAPKRKSWSSNAPPAPAPKVDKPAPAVLASLPKAKKLIQTFAQLLVTSPHHRSPTAAKLDSPTVPVPEAEVADEISNDDHDYGMWSASPGPAPDRTLSQLGGGDLSSPSSLRTELLDPALDPTFVDRALAGDKAEPEKERPVIKDAAAPSPFKTGPSPRKDKRVESAGEAPVAAEPGFDEMELEAPAAEVLPLQAAEELQELIDQLVPPVVEKRSVLDASPSQALQGVKVTAPAVDREPSPEQIEYLGNHALRPMVQQDEDEQMGSAGEPVEPERKFLDAFDDEVDSGTEALPAIKQQQQEPLEFDLVEQEGDLGSGASNAGDDEAEGDDQAPTPWQVKRDPTPTPTPTPSPSPSPSPQPKLFPRQPAHKSLAPMRSILTRRPTAGPSRATLPAPPAVQLPSNSPPAKSPSLFPRHTINFQIPLASNAPAASPRAQPRASTSGAKPLAATATTATAAEPRIESANPKEKTKKRRSHRPAKVPAPAPLDDEMQEVADALQGVMDQVLKQHQDRRSSAATSFAESRAVIHGKAEKLMATLHGESAVVVAGARETLEKIEASNVKLRELCAKRGISV